MLTRIIVGIIGIPVFIALILLGNSYLFALILILSNLSIWEYLKIAREKQAAPIASLAYIFNSLFISILFLGLFYGGDYSGINPTPYLIILLLLNTLAHSAANLWNKHPNNTTSIATGITSFNYITLLFASILCISQFRNFSEIFLALPKISLIQMGGIDWNIIVLSTFISIWASDSFAYFVGRSIGKHKLFERISPKKSWEGAIGGFFGAIVGFALPVYYLAPAFSFTLSLILGGLIGIVGPLGDLSESQLKRDAGIKDSSNIIPGHGGVLDRFDSMLFAAPTVLIVLISYYLLIA